MGLLLSNLLAATAMAGLSWFISVVHYPLFARVGTAAFPAYHAAHGTQTTWVVLPLMSVELVGAGWIALTTPDGASPALAWLGAALAAGTWAATGLLAVPDHRRLGAGWDPGVGRHLVRGHHVRTALWTAHVAVATALVAGAT